MPFAPPAHPVPEKAVPAALTAPLPAASAGTAAPSRVGKVLVSGFFDPAVRRALKCLAIERSCSQQELLAHALRLLFAQAISQGSRLVTTLPEQLQAPEEGGTSPRQSRG
jgi:hypothetical protein